MKITHCSLLNGSGMHRVAEQMQLQEKALGHDSALLDVSKIDQNLDPFLDSDIFVVHTHLPDPIMKRRKKESRIVHISHGTPEHIFTGSVDANANVNHAAHDGLMLLQYWLQYSDAIVTFWPRHQWILQSMCDKNTVVDCVPLGVDKEFWKPVSSAGKYIGTPSLFTAENCHRIKWPLDLLIAWPYVADQLQGARLHISYLPNDQHRWFMPLMNRNGSAYNSFTNSLAFGPENLRNAFCSVDYYIGLVRYGDFNKISLEANACGCKTISYEGNPYSDYWIKEGDQREMANQLLQIISGDMKPREKKPVPHAIETTIEMIKIYERVLNRL